MTPTWNIADPVSDFVAKPAITESFSGMTLLDLVLDNVLGSGLVSRTLIRVGDNPDRIEQEPSEFLRSMKRKARADLIKLISRRKGVGFFHNNPDGADNGTGASVLSREAKRTIDRDRRAKYVLFLASDLPTVSGERIEGVVRQHHARGNDVTLTEVVEEDPSGHGRIVRYPLMFMGIEDKGNPRRRSRGRTSERLDKMMKEGEIVVLELKGASTPPEAPWAKYIVLEKHHLNEVKQGGTIVVHHPLRGAIHGDKLTLDQDLIESMRVTLDPDARSIWDERSGEFLGVVEQVEIGSSEDDRAKRGEVRFARFEWPLSTEYLHSIRERNVLCMVVSKAICRNTIRDLDAMNYARVVRENGKKIVVPNRLIRSSRGGVIRVDGTQVSKDKVTSSIQCVKVAEGDGRCYVLERHPDGEYYLPEVANKVAELGGRVGVHRFPEGSANGIDTRTDLRKLSDLLMRQFIGELESAGVDVSSLRSMRATEGASTKDIRRGSTLKGFVHISGKAKVNDGAYVEDSFIESDPGRFTEIGKGARVIRSIIRNSLIEGASVIEDSILDGVRVPGGSVVKARRIVQGREARESESASCASDLEAIFSGLSQAGEVETEVLELVFGVTIHPGSRIFMSRELKELLRALSDAMNRAGGSKSFCAIHGDSLRQGAYEEVLGRAAPSGARLRLGPNVQMALEVGLSGPVEVGSFARLERCFIRSAEIGSHALVRSAVLDRSVVESSSRKHSKIEAAKVSQHVIEAGYPSLDLIDLPRSLPKIGELAAFFRSQRSTQALARIYGGDRGLVEERRARILELLLRGSELFGEECQVAFVRVPGRVNLMGRHIDHKGGFVNPIAIPRDVLMVARPREDQVVTLSNVDENYPQSSFNLMADGPREKMTSPKQWRDWTQINLEERRSKGIGPSWAEYCKSAVYLQNYYLSRDGSAVRELRGADVLVSGDIPMSVGLSSSSALVVGTYLALVALNALKISKGRLIELCGEGEWYVGTRGGCGDHAAMMWAKRGKVCHIGFFPLSVSWANFPDELLVVICNSLVQARKMADAKSKFNEKVATYEVALMRFLDCFPQYAGRVKLFRDISPGVLGVSLVEFYRMMKVFPEKATRGDLRAALHNHREELEGLFREHAEPSDGYNVRGVALFGISECERAKIAPEFLAERPKGFGALMKVSHDADREVVRTKEGIRKWDVSFSDEWLNSLAEKSSGRPPERAKLHMQSGFYGCGHETTDLLVDLALSVPGVMGAQIVGAGLGGCVVALAKKKNVDNLLRVLAEKFYGSLDRMTENVVVCSPTEGATIFRLPDDF